MNSEKRTVNEVLNLETGEIIHADVFFNSSEQTIFDLRYKLEEAIQNQCPIYVCLFCKQIIKIRGGKTKNKSIIYHFGHIKDSEDCDIKTNTRYSREVIQKIKYNGAKESKEHIQLKEFIDKKLTSTPLVNNVLMEKVVKDKKISRNWKKPDIQFQYSAQKCVIELQLSTTFLDVIVSRQHFYRENGTYIIWVFSQFDTDQFNQKFTQKDVFYSNNMNAFVIDKEAIKESSLHNELRLKCYYQEIYFEYGRIKKEWKKKLIKLSELTFDKSDYSVFFYNSAFEYSKSKQELEKYKYNEKSDIQIILNSDSENRKQLIFNAFDEGFRANDFDKEFLEKSLKFELDPDVIEDIVFAIIFVKAQNEYHIYEKIPLVRNTLYTLISIKLGRVVGFKFPKLISVIHNEFYHRKKYYELIMKALKKYNRFSSILAQDQNGSLRKKINDISTANIEQEKKFDEVFKTILPELF